MEIQASRSTRQRQLPDGMHCRYRAYYARFSVDGRQIRRKLSNDYRVACEMLQDLKLKAYRNDQGIVDNDYPIDRLFAEWLRSVEQTAERSTLARYRNKARSIQRLLPVNRVSLLTFDQVDEFRRARLAEGTAPSTVNQEIQTLLVAVNWAVRRHKIGSNPIARLKPLPQHDKQARPLTVDEVNRLLAAASRPLWRDIWYAYLTTGMRKMELAQLIFSDVDWRTRELIVRGTGAKNKTTRRIPMDDELFRIVTQQHDQAPQRRPVGNNLAGFTRERVFVTAGNRSLPPATLYRQFCTTCRRAGIPMQTLDAAGNVVEIVDLHSTRHTFATHILLTGESPKTVQDLLGHKTLEMTMNVYGKVFPENKRRAIGKLPYGSGIEESPDVLTMQS